MSNISRSNFESYGKNHYSHVFFDFYCSVIKNPLILLYAQLLRRVGEHFIKNATQKWSSFLNYYLESNKKNKVLKENESKPFY